MKVYITGSSGMVGRNVLEHPKSKSFDLYYHEHSKLDLLNYNDVYEKMYNIKPDIVIHCAGRVGGIHANMASPTEFLVDNIEMGKNIIIASRDAGVPKLINLGSSCMYPKDHEGQLEENLVLKGELEPTNEGYAIAKIAVAKLCEYITKQYPSFNYKTLIPCNIYGRWDKFSPEHSHLVPAIINKIHYAKKNNLKEVEIWGDGNAKREFLFSSDLADCIWHAVEKFETLPSMMNVGKGEDITVNMYYQIIAEIIGYDGKFVHDLSKPTGMKRKIVDTNLALQWGWKAKTSLREGVAKTYEFYKLHIGENK